MIRDERWVKAEKGQTVHKGQAYREEHRGDAKNRYRAYAQEFVAGEELIAADTCDVYVDSTFNPPRKPVAGDYGVWTGTEWRHVGAYRDILFEEIEDIVEELNTRAEAYGSTGISDAYTNASNYLRRLLQRWTPA